jgi:epoxyqueuosine reductase
MKESLESRLKSRARDLGFALAGIAPATEADGFARFAAWLDAGHAGAMDYLHRQREARRHPRSILESVRSVLMVGMEYGADPQPGDSGLAAHRAKTAKYAQGPDYHRHLWDRLNELAEWLEGEVPCCIAYGITDTAPLLERDFARRAGLGWIGKNTMLIHPRHGSFFFLGALLTDLVLAPDQSFEESHCGTCTACLDTCPTQAFPEPGVLNATRCISYLTIELRSSVPEDLREPMGDWLYGCDVCQDVCPWNHKWAGRRAAAFPHDPALAALDPTELLGMDEPAFRERFKKTSLWRNRRPGLLRNAAIVLGNTGDEQALPALERALMDKEEVIRDASAWAIERIRQRTSRA